MVGQTALSPSPQWPAAALEGTLLSSSESWPAPGYPFFPKEVIGVAIVAASVGTAGCTEKALGKGYFFPFPFCHIACSSSIWVRSLLRAVGHWTQGAALCVSIPC